MVVITKNELSDIRDIARRLYQRDIRSLADGQIDRDMVLLEALEIYLRTKKVEPSFEVGE